jgi:MoaA/NifB/PqqE/SkfB family radical SAM enzyme
MELFDALLDEMGEYLFLIDFHSWGEPLLNEHTPEFIRKANAYKIETVMHTNLSLKLSEQQLENVLTAGLDLLVASVDGFSQQAYERFRVGGDIELVKENLIKAARVRDRLGLSNAIIYKFLVFSWNEGEIEAARQFCDEHGLIFLRQDGMVPDAEWLPSYRKDEIPFISLDDVNELDKQWEQAGQPGYWKEHEKHAYYMPVATDLNWIPTHGPQVDSFCGWHYSVAVIQPGGQLTPCCITAKQSDRYGTVVPGEVSLADVWNNENYRKSRAVFSDEKVEGLENVDTVCCRCYYPDALKHSQSNNDSKIIGQFLSVFESSHPQYAEAFKLLSAGESQSVRERYVTLFEEQLAGLIESDLSERYSIAGSDGSERSQDAPVEPVELSFEDAAKIAQGYMTELSRIGMNGQTVHDVSHLPYSKAEITAALSMMLEATSDEDARKNYKNGVMVLAFFQPDIGASSVAIDQMAPQQTSWQEVVAREMRARALP